MNRHLLQLNLISLQSTETRNEKVYPTHKMSRLHKMLNTEWKCHDASDSDCACPQVRTLNTPSLNL
jgi:hypothetical protein